LSNSVTPKTSINQVAERASLPEAQLTLSETALQTLRQGARAMGVDEA